MIVLDSTVCNDDNDARNLCFPAAAMSKEAGPNHIGYFKHLTSKLLMDNEVVQLPSPEFKKEKLKIILNDSLDFLMRETDRINDQILAKLNMDLDRSNMERSDQRANDCSKKCIATSIVRTGILNGGSIGKVYNDAQTLQGKCEAGPKDIQKYSAALQSELDKMEQEIAEFLNIIFSKCRPMGSDEKERLGWLVKKLPEKARDHVVQIVAHGDVFETEPSQVSVDLNKLDDSKLWRLYYYVHSVLQANKVSGCSPTALPLA